MPPLKPKKIQKFLTQKFLCFFGKIPYCRLSQTRCFYTYTLGLTLSIIDLVLPHISPQNSEEKEKHSDHDGKGQPLIFGVICWIAYITVSLMLKAIRKVKAVNFEGSPPEKSHHPWERYYGAQAWCFRKRSLLNKIEWWNASVGERHLRLLLHPQNSHVLYGWVSLDQQVPGRGCGALRSCCKKTRWTPFRTAQSSYEST